VRADFIWNLSRKGKEIFQKMERKNFDSRKGW
jgi:hypothetical protein